MKNNEFSIDSIEMVKPSYDSNASAAAIMTLRLKQKKNRYEVISKINAIEGVEFVEEI
jgi:putative Mg2+ transporter-C (MgtC) family protein